MGLIVRWVLVLGLIIAGGPAAVAAAQAPEPAEGVWFTPEHKAAIAIYRCGAALCGRIAWIDRSHPPPGASGPPVDRFNADPALRGRVLCGLDILWGFQAAGAGRWQGGTLYDPEHGQTWRAELAVEGADTLRLRGYLLIPLLGRTQAWTRAPAGAVTPCRDDRPAPPPPAAGDGGAARR